MTPPFPPSSQHLAGTHSRIVNQCQLGLAIRLANSFASRLQGLIGYPQIQLKQGLLIKPCSSVHTAWVRYPIDVIFMDKFGLITRIVVSLKPWRMAKAPGWLKSSCMVLELASGQAQALGLEAGMIIRIDYTKLNKQVFGY